MKNPDKSPVIDQPASGILEIPRPTRSEVVGVIRAAREYRLVAICPIPAGDLLFRIEGVQTTTPHTLFPADRGKPSRRSQRRSQYGGNPRPLFLALHESQLRAQLVDP